jgi:hypothetical protein
VAWLITLARARASSSARPSPCVTRDQRPPPFPHVPPRALWLECEPVEVEEKERPPPRRLNWTEAISRAQRAPTKGPSRLNQRLVTPTGGLGRPGEPVVGSPTHPAMPNLVVLWNMSPLRGGVRAGARLWARGPARRSWVTTGPKPKPGGAGGPPGPLRGEARRPGVTY